MNLPKYELKSEKSLFLFEFISDGPKGRIQKLVRYSETNLQGVYNLAFGDKDESTGKINDIVISNNGDSEKVLATVVSTIYAFTDKYPESYVYAQGSTHSRTRLYRIGISRYSPEILIDFILYGLLNEEWEEFKPGNEYEAFLVKRKNV